MTLVEVVGALLAFFALSAIAVIFVVRSRAEQAIHHLEIKNRMLTHKVNLLISERMNLTQAASVVNSVPDEAKQLLKEIGEHLEHLGGVMGVKAMSVIVPYPSSDNTKFAFLSILGEEAKSLRNTLIDIDKGFAGYVYKQGAPLIVNDVSHDKRWYRKIDNRIPFKTHNLLCMPLIRNGQRLGVLQIINKPAGFRNEDISVAKSHMAGLTDRVEQFVAHEHNFRALGLAYSHIIDEGTILVANLSHLSSLFQGENHLPAAEIITIVNEYFEALSLIGLSYGGNVDAFSWGGFVMSFNVSKHVPKHRLAAVRAAFEMNTQFEKLKGSWQTEGYGVGNLYHRIAVASGVLLEVSMAPSDSRQRTVIGDPVVIASTLCAMGPKDRNVVTVEPTVYQALESLNCKKFKLTANEMGQARDLVTEAYYLEE